MKLYYLLALEGGEAPNKQHRSFLKACDEAVRLTRLTGKRCRIMIQIGMTFPMGGKEKDGRPGWVLLKNFFTGAQSGR